MISCTTVTFSDGFRLVSVGYYDYIKMICLKDIYCLQFGQLGCHRFCQNVIVIFFRSVETFALLEDEDDFSDFITAPCIVGKSSHNTKCLSPNFTQSKDIFWKLVSVVHK